MGTVFGVRIYLAVLMTLVGLHFGFWAESKA